MTPASHRFLRILRLHTFLGQVVFLGGVSTIGAWGMLQFREDGGSPSRYREQQKLRNANAKANGDLVDAITQTGTGTGNVVGVGVAAKGGVTLADVLTADRGVSLWWSYARDNKSITDRITSRSMRTTLLVPVDKAIQGMRYKPHQSSGYGIFGGTSGSNNTERFLKAHISEDQGKNIFQSGQIQTLLDGFTIDIQKDKSAKGGWRLSPGDIEVIAIKETANGRILFIDRVLPY